MKKINFDVIKELAISLLIVIVIALILSVIFYDKIALGRIIPQSEEYQLTDEMQEDLENGILEETKEIVTTYEIDAADLKKYEKTKEYNKGKVNPFAVESTNSVDTTTNNTINEEINDSTDNNGNETNYYPKTDK